MKYHFSETGVIELNDYLELQTEEFLEQEAVAVRSDFVSWLKRIFFFDEDQIDYLDSLNPVFLNLASQNIAIAIEKRLSITLVKPSLRAAHVAEPTGSKLIRDTSKVSVVAGIGNDYVAFGEAIFEINYNN